MAARLALWAFAAGILGAASAQNDPAITPAPSVSRTTIYPDSVKTLANGLLQFPSSYDWCDPITIIEVSVSISIQLGGEKTVYVTKTKTDDIYITDVVTRTATLVQTATQTVTDVEATTRTVTDNETKTVTDHKTKTITDHETKTVTDRKTRTVTDTRTKTKTKTVTDTKTRTVTDNKTRTITDNETQTVTDVETATQTVTDVETATQTVTDNETQTVTDNETQTVTDVETATQTVTDNETQTVTDVETATQTVTDNETATRTVTDNETATQTVTDLETVTDVLPGTTITSDILVTTTITQPPVTVTTTISGSVTTITLPATTVVKVSTVDVVTTVVGPTVTEPGKTVSVYEISTCAPPTNTGPVVPQATGKNTIWGCLPGYICNPPMPAGCNFWASAPDLSYQCDAQFCIPSPPLPDIDWPTNETGYYPPTPGYFNLDPNAFGLSYDIFVADVVVTYVIGKDGDEHLTTYTTGNWASQTSITHFPLPTPVAEKRNIVARTIVGKRDNTIIPGVCYRTCNAAYNEAERFGLVPKLCTDAAFEGDIEACRKCVAFNSPGTKGNLGDNIEPSFAPYLSYCSSATSTGGAHFVNSTTIARTSTRSSSVTLTPPPTTSATSTATTTPAGPGNTGPVGTAPTSQPSNTVSGPTTAVPSQITNFGNSLQPSTLLGSIVLAALLSLLL